MKELKVANFTISKDSLYRIIFTLGVLIGANYAMMEGGSNPSIILYISWVPIVIFNQNKILKGTSRMK